VLLPFPDLPPSLINPCPEFQRLYTPTAFREERILWRAVIQLNIVRSIRTILDATLQTPVNSPYSSPKLRARSVSLTRPPIASTSTSPPLPPQRYSPDEPSTSRSSEKSVNVVMSLGSPPPYPPPLPPHRRNLDDSALEFDDLDSEYPSSQHRSSHWNLSVSNNNTDTPQLYHPSPSSSFTVAQSPLEVLRARLAPLRHVEALLISKLVQPDENEAAAHFAPAVAMSNTFDELPSPTTSHFTHYPRSRNNHFRNQEISVRPGPGWRGVLSRARVDLEFPSADSTNGQFNRNSSSKEIRDEAQEMLYSCRKDMMQLWHDPVVKEILRRRKIRLEESSGLWVALSFLFRLLLWGFPHS